jgi:short subunit dehydrogenase-like uncharacterized protein
MRSVPVGQLEADFDFGNGPSRATAINWCDTFTAYLSTGVPNIEVYLEANALERWLYALSSSQSSWIQNPLVQAFAGASADVWLSRQGKSLSTALAQRNRCMIVEARDHNGAGVQLRLTTPDPYQVTSDCALAIVERVLAGAARPGFCTPGMLFGDTLLAQISGANIERRTFQQ